MSRKARAAILVTLEPSSVRQSITDASSRSEPSCLVRYCTGLVAHNANLERVHDQSGRAHVDIELVCCSRHGERILRR